MSTSALTSSTYTVPNVDLSSDVIHFHTVPIDDLSSDVIHFHTVPNDDLSSDVIHFHTVPTDDLGCFYVDFLCLLIRVMLWQTRRTLLLCLVDGFRQIIEAIQFGK